jgi:hypothetical protein
MRVYALGRGLEPYDMPTVRWIVAEAAAESYRFSAVIDGVVNSTPFRMRRAARRGDTAAPAAVRTDG